MDGYDPLAGYDYGLMEFLCWRHDAITTMERDRFSSTSPLCQSSLVHLPFAAVLFPSLVRTGRRSGFLASTHPPLTGRKASIPV